MDRLQIALKVALKSLDIPLSMENYNLICDVSYIAQQRGLYFSPSRILYNPRTNSCFSPMSHESGGNPSRNLKHDLAEITNELDRGFDESVNWELEEKSKKKLMTLKSYMEKYGVKNLLRICYEVNVYQGN